jgi:hypothetical protein
MPNNDANDRPDLSRAARRNVQSRIEPASSTLQGWPDTTGGAGKFTSGINMHATQIADSQMARLLKLCDETSVMFVIGRRTEFGERAEDA